MLWNMLWKFRKELIWENKKGRRHSWFTKRSISLHLYNNYKRSYHEKCKNVVMEEFGKNMCQDLVLTIVKLLIDDG